MFGNSFLFSVMLPAIDNAKSWPMEEPRWILDDNVPVQLAASLSKSWSFHFSLFTLYRVANFKTVISILLSKTVHLPFFSFLF